MEIVAQVIGQQMVLRRSPTEIAEYVLTALRFASPAVQAEAIDATVIPGYSWGGVFRPSTPDDEVDAWRVIGPWVKK